MTGFYPQSLLLIWDCDRVLIRAKHIVCLDFTINWEIETVNTECIYIGQSQQRLFVSVFFLRQCYKF